MPTQVQVSLNDRLIDSLTQPGGMADRAAAKLAGRVRGNAQVIITRERRVRTGRLRQSIRTINITNSNTEARYDVGSRVFYAYWQHEGSPVANPGSQIRPRTARVLRFPQPRTAKGRRKKRLAWVYTPYVTGFEGIHYLSRALEQLRDRDAV